MTILSLTTHRKLGSFERNQVHSPFLRFPAESHNIIYSISRNEADVHIVDDLRVILRR